MSIFELQYKFLRDEVHAMTKFAEDNEEEMGRNNALTYWVEHEFDSWKDEWCRENKIEYKDLMK